MASFQRLWAIFLQASLLTTAPGKCQPAKCPKCWTGSQWLMWFVRLHFLPEYHSGFYYMWMEGWNAGGWGSLRKHVTAKESYYVWSSCWMQDILPISSFLILTTLLGRPFWLLIMVLAIQLLYYLLEFREQFSKRETNQLYCPCCV